MSKTSDKEILQTDLKDVAPVTRGKVRDIYDLGNRLLIVARPIFASQATSLRVHRQACRML